MLEYDDRWSDSATPRLDVSRISELFPQDVSQPEAAAHIIAGERTYYQAGHEARQHGKVLRVSPEVSRRSRYTPEQVPFLKEVVRLLLLLAATPPGFSQKIVDNFLAQSKDMRQLSKAVYHSVIRLFEACSARYPEFIPPLKALMGDAGIEGMMIVIGESKFYLLNAQIGGLTQENLSSFRRETLLPSFGKLSTEPVQNAFFNLKPSEDEQVWEYEVRCVGMAFAQVVLRAAAQAALTIVNDYPDIAAQYDASLEGVESVTNSEIIEAVRSLKSPSSSSTG